jgi:hypothetical protein
MANMNQKRAFVAELYSGPGWKRRVANMSDARVTAIYLKHMDDTPHTPKKEKESTDDPPPF